MSTRSRSRIYKYLSLDQRRQLLTEQVTNFEAQLLNNEMDVMRLEAAAEVATSEEERTQLARAIKEREDAMMRIELAVQITERELHQLDDEQGLNGAGPQAD